MRPIPAKLRKLLNEDPFMDTCVITGSRGISWEHCWIYANKQINEIWAIVPLRRDLNTSSPDPMIKKRCKLISLERAKQLGLWDEIKVKYPKENWDHQYKYLYDQINT